MDKDEVREYLNGCLERIRSKLESKSKQELVNELGRRHVNFGLAGVDSEEKLIDRLVQGLEDSIDQLLSAEDDTDS